ncbi:hypothetical protein TSUD_202590 [Trifolium subterraneum]|uniref:Uncharacterized protein n=1 Tax=Trifolium subterraneum TaxID=3900 RepID=A0A2Z6M0D6_TRISU|nr:hypothetical protein TSUD_202590 [Trifolium subterraneum]
MKEYVTGRGSVVTEGVLGVASVGKILEKAGAEWEALELGSLEEFQEANENQFHEAGKEISGSK